jgi:myo-inositol-1(or 4)-monophosphatase
MVMAAVYNPHLQELFFAEKGKGATLNEKAIHVSEQTQTIKACLVTGFPYTYLNMSNGPLKFLNVSSARGSGKAIGFCCY